MITDFKKKFYTLSLFTVLSHCVIFAVIYVNFTYKPDGSFYTKYTKKLAVNKDKVQESTTKQEIIISDYPYCFAEQCPEYFSMDVDGDRQSESVVVQHTAMTQGAGKVLIIKNGKKIFETEELPQIWIKDEQAYDGNVFVLKYSSPLDMNGSRKDYERRYEYKDGVFTKGKEIQINLN